MNTETIKSIIMHELPKIIRTDDEVHQFILKIGREQFTDQTESNRRFDRMVVPTKQCRFGNTALFYFVTT